MAFTADSYSCLILKGVSTAQARTNSICFASLAAPGTMEVLSRGPAARVSGERWRARFPPYPRELVSLSLGMLGWCFCAATAFRWYSEQQHPKTATATAPQSRTKEEGT